MSVMANSKRYIVVLSDEMLSAFRAHCEAQGVEMSTVARTALMREIGRLDLIGTVPPAHRPKKPAADPPATPAKRGRPRKSVE